MIDDKTVRTAVEKYWTTADARDWDAFATLIAEDVVYELPQSRERITGKEKYVRFNREYPGDWRASLHRVVAEADGGVSWIKVVADGETVDAVTFFEVDDDGLFARITDFWPESYEPPAGR
ncbi:MAG TPA: nuclear transport factor 2 family protein, partial [Phytomonospora sp.]